jgi:hypothetical protein
MCYLNQLPLSVLLFLAFYIAQIILNNIFLWAKEYDNNRDYFMNYIPFYIIYHICTN